MLPLGSGGALEHKLLQVTAFMVDAQMATNKLEHRVRVVHRDGRVDELRFSNPSSAQDGDSAVYVSQILFV